MATKQNKQFQRWRHLKTRWWLWWPSWISNRQSVRYFRFRGHAVATVCFNSKHPMVWVEKSKIGFQDSDYGDHFLFPIGIILAIFHLHVNPLLICTFHLNSPCGLLEDVKNWFSRWWLLWPSWILDQNYFSSFWSRSYPVVTEQVSVQINQRFGKRCQKLIFKMAATAILDFWLAQF